MALKRKNNLSKYDAPLSIQFKKGYNAFLYNGTSSYNKNTMQYREWQRGYDSAFFKNLEKVKQRENRRRSKEVYGRT